MLSPGDQLGDYEIVRHLGSGSSGDVYQARRSTTGTAVSLKVCRSRNPEVDVLQRLQHSGIPSLIEDFHHDDQHVTVLKFVDGVPLATLLAAVHGIPRRRTRVAGVPKWQSEIPACGRERLVDFGCRIVEETARTLQYAHGRNVYHHDVKPENILVNRDGAAVLIDWGIAAGAKSETGLTAGTLSYMSTQAVEAVAGLKSRAENDSTTSPAADDVFALGIVLYELVAGTLPFPVSHGDTSIIVAAREVLANRPLLSNKVAGHPDIPGTLRAIIQACVCSHADNSHQITYAEVSQLADDLHNYRTGRRLRHVRESRVDRISRMASRYRNTWIVCLLLLLGLVIAFAVDRQQTERRLAAAQGFRRQIHDIADQNIVWPSQIVATVFESGVFPDSVSLKQQRVQVAHGLAAACLQHNQPGRAVTFLQRSIELSPEDGELHNDLGTAYYQLRSFESALTEFDRALELPCDHASVLSNRGATWAALARPDKARRDFLAALKVDASHATAQRHLQLLDSVAPKPEHL
ncbi:MAG: protein kinase [Planctomycetaceae bacterium]